MMNCWKPAFAGLLLVALSPLPSPAEVSGVQRKVLSEIAAAIRTAGQLYIAEDYEACGKEIRGAQDQLVELLTAGDEEVHAAAEPLRKRLVQAQALLELEGVVLPPLRIPEPAAPESEAKPDEPGASPVPSPVPMPDSAGVSFARDVAPLLVSKCGRCHIQARRGNFSLANFQLLMQGPPEGVVVFPGDVTASRLIETVETGDMPRGGGKVSEDELQLLKDWVASGAPFDGPGPAVPLADYTNAASGSAGDGNASDEMQTPTVRQATGDETVSFARQVAPVLLESCSGCHIDAMQLRGGLRMDTFAGLMQGGDTGPVVQPGNAVASLLIQKLRGEVGQRMPLGRPTLPEEQIELISTWINEGATLDGRSADQPLRSMADMAWAVEATDGELSERRAELAAEHWRLGSPDTPATTKTTDDFLIMGTVAPGTFAAVADAAQQATRMARSSVRIPSDEAIRGRITIFVFPRRYDYSEFGRMIEQRELPSQWREHWSFDGVDAYIALVAGAEDEPEQIAARIAGALVSLQVAALGDAPRWLSEGLGRAAWARLAGRRSERARDWNAQLPAALQAMKKPDDLMQGRLPPEQADVLAYGLGLFLLDRQNRRGTDSLLRALGEGANLDQAMQAAFGRPAEAIIPVYVAWQRMQLQ